jgi:CO dehydrogenase maturation factor
MARVAVAGKGGSGKTTIAASLARLSGRTAGRMVAIDGDPNPNLARAMGIERSEWPLLPADLIATVHENGDSVRRLGLPLAEILERYAVQGPDGVSLLALGEVDAAGKGCLCSKHAIVREVVAAALSGADGPLVLDMEASLEHMRRGTVRHVDTLLVVTEPYYRSLEAAGRLARLARELGLSRIAAVANKVRNQEEELAVLAYLERVDVPVVATIPLDEQVTEADLHGRSLLDSGTDSRALQAIERLAGRIFA